MSWMLPTAGAIAELVQTCSLRHQGKPNDRSGTGAGGVGKELEGRVRVGEVEKEVDGRAKANGGVP